MKNCSFFRTLLFLAFSSTLSVKINAQGDENKILFIQPSHAERNYKDWMIKEESKLDPSKCNVKYDDLILKDLTKPYSKKKKDELELYKFWMYKTVIKNGELVTIKYELEDRRVNPKVKKVLGVFKGFDQNEFEEWFSKSIFKYCNKLLESGNLNLTSVWIGLMAANPEDIYNTPSSLNMNLLDYKFKEAAQGIFTDRYAVQIDDKVSSVAPICINMEKMDSIKDKDGSYYKRIYLQVVVKSKPNPKKTMVNLNETFDASLRTASKTIAEIIATGK